MLRREAAAAWRVTDATMELERRVSGHFVRWVFEGVKGGPLAHSLRASGLGLSGARYDFSLARETAAGASALALAR